MRFLKHFVIVLLATSVIYAQTGADPDKNERVREELRNLLSELNGAFEKRDRPALEKIYADEFIYIHASGYVDDKTTHIDEAFSIEIRKPLFLSDFKDLYVYGDVAILRTKTQIRTGEYFFGTSIFAKRNGRWQITQSQGTFLLPERVLVEVDPQTLDSYVGKYKNEANELLTISREEKLLTAALHRVGIPKRKLISTSETQFFDKLGAEYNFFKQADGKIVHLRLRFRDRESVWKRLD